MSSSNGHGHVSIPDIPGDDPTIELDVPANGNGHAGVAVQPVPEGSGDAAQPVAPAKKSGGLREVLAAARDFSKLRGHRYGAAPAVMIAAAAFFQVFDTQAFRIAGPELVREYRMDIATLVAIQQFIGFFSLFAMILLGWHLDRARRVPFYVAGTIGSGIFSMLTAGAGSPFMVGLPRVLDDVSDQASRVPQVSLLSDYYPMEARGKVFALLGICGVSAAVLAPPIAGGVVTVFGVRAAFLAFGAPLVLIGIVAALVLREPVRGYFERKAMGVADDVAIAEDEPVSFGEAWRTTWAVRTIRRAFFGMMIIFPGTQAFLIFSNFFIFSEYGLSAAERGLIAVPQFLAAMVGGFLGGGMVDRLSERDPARVFTLFAVFVSVAGVGLLALAFTPPLFLLVGVMMVFAGGISLTGPAFFSVISQVVPPSIRTQGLQIYALHELPGLLIGLGIFTAIFTNYGYSGIWFSAVPVMLIGAAVFATAGPFFELDRRNATAAAVAAEEWRQTTAAGAAKLLVCRDVDVAYDNVQVLFGVDFDVEAGEIIALLGTNGAGKSTLLRAISGSQEASGGAILFNGRDITHMPPHEIARRRVIHMPGGRGIFPGLSVRDNLLLGAWMMPSEDQERRLAEVDQIFPVLKERANADAGALSGGEQQQLSLAQAFLSDPELLMIDELSLGLAPAVVEQLLDKVRQIHARGTTVIIVEQSVNVALTLATRAIFMEKGEVKFFGETAELLSRPDILRAVYVKGTGALTDGPVAARRSTQEQARLDRESAANILVVEGISKRYGGVSALDDVSFALQEGSALGVIGPNGSGKTTLFDVISGFQPPQSGRILYQGQDITGLAPEERSRRRLVRRFQDAKLFPSLTVYETLLVALDQRMDVRNPLLHALKLPNARRAEARMRVRADRLVELLELGAFRDKFIKELSTGVRRIVDIACTLATEPKLLLLDEPSSGIAQSDAEGLAPLLRRIRFETGCTMLIIEHDMPLLARVTDEMLVLDRGRLLLRGDPETVLNDERVVEAYLGTTEDVVKRSGGMR